MKKKRRIRETEPSRGSGCGGGGSRRPEQRASWELRERREVGGRETDRARGSESEGTRKGGIGSADGESQCVDF